MKKLLAIAFLVIGMMVNAQKSEYFTISLAVDPNATIKENSPNLVAELEYVNNLIYIKATTQVLPNLEGGYWDFGGAGGLNIHLNRWKTSRAYAGGRLGIIKRDGNSYPLAGFEGGVDFDVTDSMFIGVRGTGDYREDFEFWGGEAEMRYSGFLRIGFKF